MRCDADGSFAQSFTESLQGFSSPWFRQLRSMESPNSDALGSISYRVAIDGLCLTRLQGSFPCGELIGRAVAAET